jgi:hypothetical protein
MLIIDGIVKNSEIVKIHKDPPIVVESRSLAKMRRSEIPLKTPLLLGVMPLNSSSSYS